jgi:hypothetical protein
MWDGSHKYWNGTHNNSRPPPLVNLTGEVTVVNSHGCIANYGRTTFGLPFVDPTVTVHVTCMKKTDDDDDQPAAPPKDPPKTDDGDTTTNDGDGGDGSNSRPLLKGHRAFFMVFSPMLDSPDWPAAYEVRKTPSWPRSWANFSLL